MDPTPCLLSSPQTFGQRLVFGLLTDEGFHPVRGMPVNKVRRLGEPKIALPNKPVIHALGDVCIALLDAAEVWEVMLHAMADDMYQAFCAAHVKKPKPKKPKPPPFDLATYLMERDHDGT